MPADTTPTHPLMTLLTSVHCTTTLPSSPRAPKFYQFLRSIEPYLYSASGTPKAKTFIGRNHSYPLNRLVDSPDNFISIYLL